MLHSVVFHEYFYQRLSELEEKEREIVMSIRTKKGLIILCDKLRNIEIEKNILISVYEDLKPFYG